MQRNVLYTLIGNRTLKFALSMAVVFLLSACDGSVAPWETSLNSRTPPAPTLPNQSSALPPSVAAPSTVNPLTPMPAPGTKSKVALLLPLSGRGSDAGQAMLNAAQLAMFDLGADAFELMPKDTGASEDTARQVATDSIRDGASLILGPLFAADAKAIAPIALQSNINVVSFSTDTSAAGGNVFILGFLPQSQVKRILEYANGKALTHIALIAPRDQYGNTVAETYDTNLRLRGATSAGILRYDGAQPSPDEIKQFVTGKTIDAVLIAANAAQASTIAQSLPANIQRLGTGLWDQADATKLVGLQGAWYAASSPHLRQKFEKRYRDTYGENPPRLASLAYDAAALAVVLSKQGNGLGKNALLNQSGFAGIDGIFRFQNDGLNERGLAVLQVGSGTASIIEEAPTAFH